VRLSPRSMNMYVVKYVYDGLATSKRQDDFSVEESHEREVISAEARMSPHT